MIRSTVDKMNAQYIISMQTGLTRTGMSNRHEAIHNPDLFKQVRVPDGCRKRYGNDRKKQNALEQGAAATSWRKTQCVFGQGDPAETIDRQEAHPQDKPRTILPGSMGKGIHSLQQPFLQSETRSYGGQTRSHEMRIEPQRLLAESYALLANLETCRTTTNRADCLRQAIGPVRAILVAELDGLPRKGVPCMVKVTIEMDEVQLLLIALALAKLVLTATRQR